MANQNYIVNPKIEALQRSQAGILSKMTELLEKCIGEKREMTPAELEIERGFRAENESIKAQLSMLEKLAEIELAKGSAYVQRRGSDGDYSNVGNLETMGFRGAGDFFYAVQRAASQNSKVDDRLIAMIEKNERTGQTFSDPDGGFLVPAQVSKEILKKQYLYSDVVSRVREIPTMSNLLKVPSLQQKSQGNSYIFGGIICYWIPEGASITETSPQFDIINIEIKKQAAIVKVTNELKEDASSLEAWLGETVPEALALTLEESILRGQGTADLNGITTSAAIVTAAKESGQEADSIQYENLLQMLTHFNVPSMRRGIWLANQDCIKTLGLAGQMVGASGVPLWTGANPASVNPSLPNGQVFSPILGMPVYFSMFMETVGDLNDLILVDLSQYILATRGGIKADASMHVNFLSDATSYRFIRRVGGALGWKNSMAARKGNNTISAAVNLAARA